MSKKSAGAYYIRNTANDKLYVGSSKDLNGRRRGHWGGLRKGKHHCAHLLAAWLKHGEDRFTFEVLEHVELGEDDAENRRLLIALEQHWFDLLEPEYNTYRRAGSNAGAGKGQNGSWNVGRKYSVERCANLSKALMGNDNGKGPRSPEFCALMSAKLKGNNNCLGRVDSEETKERRNATLRALPPRPTGAKRTPEQLDNMRAAQQRVRADGSYPSQKGQKRTGQALANIRVATRNNIGSRRTPEQVENMRQAQLARVARGVLNGSYAGKTPEQIAANRAIRVAAAAKRAQSSYGNPLKGKTAEEIAAICQKAWDTRRANGNAGRTNRTYAEKDPAKVEQERANRRAGQARRWRRKTPVRS